MPKKPVKRKKNIRPAVFVVEAPQEPEPEPLPDIPIIEPIVPTREALTEQIQGLYPAIQESDREKLVEDLWSRFEFDTPYSRSYSEEKLGMPGRYTMLREWQWVERYDVLERMHQVAERNPLAKAMVMWMTTFVVGNGGMLSYRAKETQEVIEEFRNDPLNNVHAYERESCDGLTVDGEIFFRLFKNKQGRTVIIPMRPWHIHWLTTNPDNYKEVESYHYVYQIYKDQPGHSAFGIDDVPADEVIHCAINRYAYELRGRPDLFCELPWLKAYRDWLEERARINRRKTIYYVVTVKNATPSQVTTMGNKFKVPPAPGSFLVINDNVTITSVESHIAADDSAADGRQMKLMAILASGLPEFYLSEGANSTLASSNAQSLPILRKFDDRQDILEEQVWKKLYRIVVQNAVDAGRIPEEVAELDEFGNETGKKIKAIDAFSFEFPEIREKDVLNLAKALQIRKAEGWIDDSGAIAKLGDNPAEIIAKVQAEQEKQIGLAPKKVVSKKNGKAPEGKVDTKSEGQGGAPGYQPGEYQGRQLQPSAAAPNYPGNNPPQGGAG